MKRKYYAAYNKDDNIREQSSSGGIFYSLASYVISQGGVVFGATWNKDWLVDITYTTTLEGIKPMMTSKYVLSNVGRSLLDCKVFLEEGRLVLFTALPCQIHALKNFLQKDYSNLICVDICCHGTVPIQIWKDYWATLQKPNNPIVSINMRDKEHGWTNYQFVIKYQDGTELRQKGSETKYMKVMLGDAYLRPCCYDCKFKMNYSKADIMLGDYWGIHKFHPGINVGNKGISLVMVNTEKGLYILSLLDNLYFIESKEEFALQTGGGVHNKVRTDKIKPYVKENCF